MKITININKDGLNDSQIDSVREFLENIDKHKERTKIKKFNGLLEDYLKLIEEIYNWNELVKNKVRLFTY